ncbi:beta-ketoacyl synthase N-terminal-like domain-containing protein [Kitasatospora sp. NPDC048538]|uniref:type I polyketide synthase n=1 Tax=unclassified Kitasatospora TaxID=2633591 RepID=UPI0033E8471A
MTEDGGLDIAVVGLAGRFPGAEDVTALWRALLDGRPTTSRFTPEELAGSVPAAEYGRPDYVPVFGVLDGADRFDAGFFGYSPHDARLIDPQQRVFLECAWQALESAGHVADVDELAVGVYGATGMSGYLLHHLLPAGEAVGSEYEMSVANDKDAVATRAAYHLGLRGPAMAVQTACSSSLVAVHLAAQALLAGECDVALAGAAHVRLPLRAGYRYEAGGIMARDGVCRPFDASATGTVGGSGVAVVVLRRLADALADGDTVHAVLKGSAVNNDGRAKVGYTAPSVEGQVDVVRTAHLAAAVDPATIGYVEAHGTGTALGDQVELAALREVFGSSGGRRALGSVKAVTGHLDVAAGVTGLIKACLAVRHGVVPPSPYFATAHPDLAGDASFLVGTAPAPWPVVGPPRRAGVSSFGIGGTNAHVVVEQPPEPAVLPTARTEHVLVLSARTAPALDRAREELRAHLAGAGADLELADVAHTLSRTRRRFEHRLALACRSTGEAVDALSRPAALDTADGEDTDGTVAFLFPGQGAQHAGMGEELYRTEPVFREELDRCADTLAPLLGLDLRDVLHRAPDDDLLRQTRITQPALFAVEYALARLWEHRGVRPAAAAGHSVGEYAAACLAGVFRLPDALAIVAARGRLMQSLPPGAMLSVPLPAAELAARLPQGVELAAANAPALSVASGAPGPVAELAAKLRAEGLDCRELRTSHAFHSAMMEPVLGEFAEFVGRFEARAPRFPVLSGLDGEPLSAADAADPAYWARQLREPVRFDACVRRLLAGPSALLEVGPGAALTTLVRQHRAGGGRSTPSLPGPRERGGERLAMAAATGRLWLAGVDVDLHGGGPAERRRRVPLPTYPFERERHWVEQPGAAAPRTAEPAAAPGPAGTPEEVVRRIWSDLLGIPEIGPDQDFFGLGGHSLLGTKVVARIREALGVDLPVGALFDTPTLGGLTATVTTLLAGRDGPQEPAVQDPPRRPAGPDPVADEPGVPDSAAQEPAAPEQPDGLAGLLAEIRAMTPAQVRQELGGQAPGGTPREDRP